MNMLNFDIFIQLYLFDFVKEQWTKTGLLMLQMSKNDTQSNLCLKNYEYFFHKSNESFLLISHGFEHRWYNFLE